METGIDEPAILIDFLSPKKLNNNRRKLTLAGVGVRVKQIGPIKAKVYSAAVYLDKGSVETKCKGLKCISEKELVNSKEFESTVRLTSHLHLSCWQHVMPFSQQLRWKSNPSNASLGFQQVVDGSGDNNIVLRMARSVRAEAMVDAVERSVRPRMNGKDSGALEVLVKYTEASILF